MDRRLPIWTLLAIPWLLAGTVPPTEVKVGSAAVVDFEFDWGRDGEHCTDCNDGAGNQRLVHADAAGQLWVAALDPVTGAFVPPDGRGERVDHNVAGPLQVGNGPEWLVSARGSEIVYTRWTEGQPDSASQRHLGFARRQDGAWIAGAMQDTRLRQSPGGTMDPGDAEPRIVYTTAQRSRLLWRKMRPGGVERAVPLSYPPGTTIHRRWVPGTTRLILTAPAAPDPDGAVHRQVFLYDTASERLEQLTFDPEDKAAAFMWQAPELGGETVFFAVAGGTRLDIYHRAPAGHLPAWQRLNSIAMPAATPYLGSPEYFVHNGRSWVYFWLSTDPTSSTALSRIAITGIDPAVPSLRALTPVTDPPRSRRDPEHFITAAGPFIYYTRIVPPTSTSPARSEGVYRVDTGLGPRLP